jgi:RimJ/RimL family protein N-acetyltransferase
MLLQSQQYRAEEKLPDGRNLLIRSLTPDDKHFLQEGMAHLTKEDRYSRFFVFKDSLSDKELDELTRLDSKNRVGLLASVIEDGNKVPVGVAHYILCEDESDLQTAEIAFAIAHEYQGIGIGTALMKHLIAIGKTAGIRQFVAFVLPDNFKMLDILRTCGLPCKLQMSQPGVEKFVLTMR